MKRGQRGRRDCLSDGHIHPVILLRLHAAAGVGAGAVRPVSKELPVLRTVVICPVAVDIIALTLVVHSEGVRKQVGNRGHIDVVSDRKSVV